MFEAQGWDFEVTNGEIGNLAVNVPWNCLMLEDSVVEVSNLYLCLRPLARAKDDGELIFLKQIAQKGCYSLIFISLINPILKRKNKNKNFCVVT